MKFKGWDWTELMQLKKVATNWPKVPKDFKYDEKTLTSKQEQHQAYQIKTYLSGIDPDSKEEKVVAKHVRAWLTALSKGATYDMPVYKGIAACECDWQMFRWVCWNLECMWT